MTNAQVKTEELESVSNSAPVAPTADTELTEEQLEVVAGGTCIPDPIGSKYKVPGLPIENQ